MTLESQKIKYSNLEISNSGSNLLFDATQPVIFSPTTLIRMPAETLNMNGSSILNSSNLQSPVDSDITIESKGTGYISCKVPRTQTTPSMQVNDNGITYFTNIPTNGVNSTTTDNILRYNNFSNSTSFIPIASGTTSGSPTQTGTGKYTRIGNMVWFWANISIIGAGPTTGTDVVKLSIPVAVNYTSLNMPQAISITQYTGITTTGPDFSMTIGGTGDSGVPGISIDFARMYIRINNNSSGLNAITFNDLNLSNCTLSYTGFYYVF